MKRRVRVRSPLLITMGLVAILAGSLGLLCGCCGLADTALIANSASSREVRDFLAQRAPAWIPLAMIRGVLLLLLSVIALGAGVGLFLRQSWARWAAVFYGAAGLPLHLIYAIYGIGAYMPAMEQFLFEQQKVGPGFAAGFRGGFLSTFIPPIAIWIIASIILILGLMNGTASAALAPEPAEPIRDEHDDEEDDDRPRHRNRRSVEDRD